MNKFLKISGDTESVMNLLYGNRKEMPTPVQVETVVKENRILTDWKKVKEICQDKAFSKEYKVGQFLNVYSPVFGFIEWEIVRTGESDFYTLARRPIVSMQFDALEKDKTGRKENKGFRSSWGSNNPFHCAPHKFLNSFGKKGEWWKSSNEFDLEPEEHNEFPGFLSALPKEFLDCVLPTHVEMEIPECDGGGKKTQELKFFLPSKEELFETDGKKPFFTVASLKKCGCFYWLRSPYVGYSDYVYCVDATGTLNYSRADLSHGVAPACRLGVSQGI